MPAVAKAPCKLTLVPEYPTQADIDAVVIDRGVKLVTCDAARGVAVETHEAQNSLQDEWLELQRRRALPWYRRIF